jgi:hypothetical protein
VDAEKHGEEFLEHIVFCTLEAYKTLQLVESRFQIEDASLCHKYWFSGLKSISSCAEYVILQSKIG